MYPPRVGPGEGFYGEVVNEKLRMVVVEETLRRQGYGRWPLRSIQVGRMASDKFVFASKVVERHAAFVSGLGTFGLCRRPHHTPGEGHARRVSHRRDSDTRHTQALQGAPGLLPVVQPRTCKKCVGALSREGPLREGARQDPLLTSTSTKPARAISWSISASRAMPAASARRGFLRIEDPYSEGRGVGKSPALRS